MTLLERIDQYLQRTGMRSTTFGRRVAKDPRLVGDMRLGRTPGPAMTARVEAFIAEAR